MEIINAPENDKPVYRTVCFHCNTDFTYQYHEVHHNHWLNNRVRSHGFRDFEGEIRCPNCGTFLPHYMQNQVK